MEYTKLRLDFKYANKGRFYRVVLVKSDIDLGTLGELLVYALGGRMEHQFLYRDKERMYVSPMWIDDYSDEDECYSDYTLEEMDDAFSFEYDTGEGWNFSCRKYQEKEELNSDRLIIVIEAAGMGIWEDNISTLFAYLNGEIEDGYNDEDEERGIFKPWNFDINHYDEFDYPVDLEDLNEDLERFKIGYVYDEESEYEVDDDDEEEEEEDEDEEEEPEIDEAIHQSVIQTVYEQIDSLNYVKETYERLRLDYEKETAINMIASILVEEIYYTFNDNLPFDEGRYIKKLNRLK